MADLPPSSKAPSHREDALTVVRALRDAGHVAYFAGGCVRDLLLGLQPKDYDVATDAVPEKVRSLFRNTQAVGQAFGVILVRLGRSQIEVATFRSDGEYLDGRRPAEVRFANAEADAQRRDFTINGLFLDPIENRVLDFVGGQKDIQLGVLRAIGDANARFEEDHLRMLRAVRFASRFGFQIDPITVSAIRAHAPKLVHISPERIGEELKMMLTPTTRGVAWLHLRDLDLLPIVLRFVAPPRARVDSKMGDLFPLVAPAESIGFGLALAGLTLGFRIATAGQAAWDELLAAANIRAMVQACRKGLKISNDESEAMARALDVSHLLQQSVPTVAMMKRFLARPTSPDARRLLDAMYIVDPNLLRIPWLREQFAVLEKTDCAPVPLVTGDDLTAAGLSPGPLFKRVLDVIYDAQLEGRVATKPLAMEMALSLAR